MDYFFVYLFGIICFILVPFLIVLFVTWLGSYCMRCIKSSKDYVRRKRPLLPQSIPTPNIHLPIRRSLRPGQNNTRVNVPFATRQPQIIAPDNHRSCEPLQNNSPPNMSPAMHQSGMIAPSPSGSHQSNAGVNIPPLAIQQPSVLVPMPCSCGAHQSNIWDHIALQAPQPLTMTPMHYGSQLSISGTDVPVTILQSPITAHIIQGPHQSQMMTPMYYGSQTNARAHTPHGPHQSNRGANAPLAAQQPQVMTPEPREGPSSRNSDINAYLSAFIYQNNENNQNTECTVCLGELQRGEKVMKLPHCSHLYHEKCICRWLLQEPSCPLCRSPVKANLSVSVGHT